MHRNGHANFQFSGVYMCHIAWAVN